MLDFKKGEGILENGGDIDPPSLKFGRFPKFNFLLRSLPPPPPIYFGLKFLGPPLRLGGRLLPWYCQYSTKLHVKWTKIFWDTCHVFYFIHPPPNSLEFFWEIFWENASQKYNNLWVACQIWFNKSQNFRVKLYYTKFSA